jgi:hypothetical protein
MPLPPKLFYPISETANRWSVSPIDIVGWAIDGRITLSTALPLVEAKQGRPVEGLVEISGQDVFDLFDAGTNKKSTVRVQRFRRRPGARWEKIVTPADGVPLKPSGVIIARTEAERFEREHGIFGHHAAKNDQQPAKTCDGPIGQSGAPARYNWNAFAGAVARRVHDEGMPASQGELVRDMLEWFAASGRVPDESTVRRRVQALWPVLTRRAG